MTIVVQEDRVMPDLSLEGKIRAPTLSPRRAGRSENRDVVDAAKKSLDVELHWGIFFDAE
jgi:hypothetical protein